MIKGEHRNTAVILAILTVIASMLILSNRSAASEKIKDSNITDAIKLQIQYDEKINYGNLSVRTIDGVVILEGRVDNLLAKERLLETVKSIKGHKGFVDVVTVEPDHLFPDNILTLKVETLLLKDPVTESHEISVKVLNKEVLLSGKVDSFTEKKHAGNLAKSIPGVRSVDNSLQIEFKENRPDREIKSEIVANIKNDVVLEAYLLDVRVENGHAKISGVVGTEDLRRRLEANAWVAGVKKVDITQVSEKDWARNDMLASNEFKKRSNEELSKAINTALTYDPRVFSYDIEVEVNSPFVTLRGEVKSEKVRKAAVEDVQNIRGVVSVTDRIRVNSHDAVPTDEVLIGMVEDALLDDETGDYANVGVEASQGWVYLFGEVKTPFLKEHAENLINKIEGVLSVQNNLETEYEKNTLPDWIILANIKQKLVNNPFVNQSRIKVSAKDNLIILEGAVHNYTEYSLAEKIAYTAGADAVINNLAVTAFSFTPTALVENKKPNK